MYSLLLGFPHSSVHKESACNAGDPGSIPGSGRSPGEGIGYPLQYSWASLVAQLVKNPPAMRETWVWSLGWEDPLEKGKATHSSILPWRIPWTVQSMGLQRVRQDWATFTFTFSLLLVRHTSQVALVVKKKSCHQCRRCRRWEFNPWVGKGTHFIFLPGESHGQRSLLGYSPWDHKESDTTEVT